MKKFIYSTLFLGSALALASCSAEEPGISSGDGKVSLTVQLPAELATRFATGNNIDQLYYSICSTGETPKVLDYGSMTWPKGQSSTTVDLNLVPGQEYQVVFFACNGSVTTELNESVTTSTTNYSYNPSTADFSVNYGEDMTNNDAYDAFYTVEPNISSMSSGKTVNLTRVFAQVNFGTDDSEKGVVENVGLDNYKSSFTITSGLLSGVNFLSGTTTAQTTPVTFSLASLAGSVDGTFPVNTAANVPYTYLEMNYLLVNPAATEATLLNAEYSVTASGTMVNQLNLSGMPTRSNYQTNVYGSLLTAKNSFTVAISPAFGGLMDSKPISDPEKALEALNSNSSVVFNGTTDALDLTNLSNTQPTEIILSDGASVGSIKVGSNRAFAETAPLTIKVGKDVVFPTFVTTAGTPIYNLTIEGDPTAPAANASKGISFYASNIKEIKNLSFIGVHFEGNGINVQYTGDPGTVSGLTIENCVFTNLITGALSAQQHVKKGSINNDFVIRNNTITFATSGVKANENAINIADATPGSYIIEGNTITGASYHGITLAFMSNISNSDQFTTDAMNASTISLSGNTITKCGHDGIKIGYPCGTVDIFNNNVTPIEYGIRVTRFLSVESAVPTINIYKNTIDMANVVDAANEVFGAINVSSNNVVGPLLLNVYDNIKNGGTPTTWFQLQGLTPAAGSNYSTPFSN